MHVTLQEGDHVLWYHQYGDYHLLSSSSKTITISLIRQPEQGYGFEILGGNKIGIYIKSVMRWTPAEKHGIKCGWKLISVIDFDAFFVCFFLCVCFLHLQI